MLKFKDLVEGTVAVSFLNLRADLFLHEDTQYILDPIVLQELFCPVTLESAVLFFFND